MNQEKSLDFYTAVIQASFQSSVIVKFYADWCGPCQVMAPFMDEVHRASNGAWDLVSINIDNEREIATKYKIRSIPAVLLFENGNNTARFVGSKSKHQIQTWIDENMHVTEEKINPIQEAIEDNNLVKAERLVLDKLLLTFPAHAELSLLKSLVLIRTKNKLAKEYIERLSENSIENSLKKILFNTLENSKLENTTSSNNEFDVLDVSESIKVSQTDHSLINRLILDEINQWRAYKEFPLLTQKQDLMESAKNNSELDQSSYRTIQSCTIEVKFPTKKWGPMKETIGASYIDTAKLVVKRWMGEEADFMALMHPKFKFVGISNKWNASEQGIQVKMLLAS